MITFVTNYYYPEIGGASTRITELTRNLSKRGLKITVFAPVPRYPFNKDLGEYCERYTEETINENLKIIRIKVPKASTKNLKSRVISEMFFLLFALLYFIKFLRKEADQVVTSSPPFFINLFGLICKIMFNKVWIQDIRDLWPDSIAATGVVSDKSLILNFLRFLEKIYYNSASKIIVVTDAMANHIKSKLKEKKKRKIYVVSNGYTEEMSLLAKKYSYTNCIKKNEDIIIGYVGNLGRAQNLEIFVRLVKKINQECHKPRIKFLIVGEGSEKDWLLNKLSNYNSVMIESGTTDKEKIAKYYSRIDIFMIPLKDHPIFTTVIPSKIYEILIFRKPFIHFSKGELKKIGEDSGLGLFYESLSDFNPYNIYLPKMKEDFNFEVYDWKCLSKKYYELLNCYNVR